MGCGVKLRAMRVVGVLAAIIVAAGTLFAAPLPERAEAAIPSQFTPGNIISDAVFYNSEAMSVEQVQSFLNSQVKTCASGYTCLKSYTENTPARGADWADLTRK